MYDPNAPEDDLTERYEEMERMREHVFRESDSNKDNLIRQELLRGGNIPLVIQLLFIIIFINRNLIFLQKTMAK